jgi:hypothetical protein
MLEIDPCISIHAYSSILSTSAIWYYNYLYQCNNCSSLKVPGLYSTEELEPIISPLKDIAAQEGFVGSPASYFSKCKVINGSFVFIG